MKYRAQRAYTSSYRFPHYDSGISRSRPQKSEWKHQKSDYNRQDTREQFNDKCILRNSNSRSKESGIIRNEWKLKQCRYCKNIGHEIEKYCKCQYNNSQNNSSGNLQNSSRLADGPRAGPSRIRPVSVIETQETEPKEGRVESQ